MNSAIVLDRLVNLPVSKFTWMAMSMFSGRSSASNDDLPISFKGKSALNDYGVDQIFAGDTVYVEGYNDAFKVTVYENDTIRYLPFM